MALSALFAFVLLLASMSNAERLPVKTYNVADGLMRDNVYKIRQDSRGFLWFATADGISRFDGHAFTNFTPEDGLPSRHVKDFLETRGGEILIATEGGLAILNPRGGRNEGENPLFNSYLPENPKARHITVLFEDFGGRVFVGTTDGFYQLNEKFEFENISLGNSNSDADRFWITTVLQDRRGVMWIGTADSKIIRVSPAGGVEQYTTANNLPDSKISVLFEDASGQIWAGLRPGNSGGLLRLFAEPTAENSIVERHFTTDDGLPASWVTDLFESGDGDFWIATTSGLCLWQGENGDSVCRTFKENNGVCDTVSSVIEDKDGNLWAGTVCGAKKLARSGFTTYDQTDGFRVPLINSIFENRNGELFFSVNSGSGRFLTKFDRKKFTGGSKGLLENEKYSGWGWKQTVWQDSAGAWWIPGGEGLYRSPPATSFERLSKNVLQKVETGAKGNEVFRIFEDSRGDVWIATTGNANELLRRQRSSDVWRDFTEETGFGEFRMGTAFVEDAAGNLWIGTGGDGGDSALIRYRDGSFKIFTQAEGAPPGWMRDLFLDSRGRLWMANTEWGLLRLDDTNAETLNFVRYSTSEGLSSRGINCVTEDEFGRIYAGSARGLDRLNPETGQIENFTTADGLPSSFIELAYRDRANMLWFATTRGLARFKPEPERLRQPPTILITGLRAAGHALPVSVLGETEIPLFRLASDERQVSLDFIGLGASLGEKLRYEYRLAGEDWTPTAERTLNFANLAAGDYRLEVRAVSADRLFSAPAVVSFAVAAPFWQRWWFIAAISFLLFTAFYWFYRQRVSRLLELERMRTRIATDLHDDIGANLTRISLLSEVAKQKAENGNGSLLSSIADIARESVASMNDIVWAISPEHDRLLDLTRRMRLHADEIFSMRDVELEFSAPVADKDIQLSVSVRRDLLLIFKEAVNNAARHSDCSRVEVNFRLENGILSLEIRDNGRGFYEQLETDGQGLRSMKRRAAALGGNLTIESKNGTTIKFDLALTKASLI